MPDEPETEQSDSQVDSADDQYTRPISLGLVVTAASLFVAGLALLGIVAYLRVSEHSARIRFFTDSSLNLLILVAILVQAYIYVRQWAVMEHHGKAMRGQLDVMQKSLLHTMKVNIGQVNYWTAQQKAMDSQAETMQGQLAAMKEQALVMKLQQAASEAQMKIAGIAVETAEKSAIYAQRAYVTAIITDISEWQFRLRIENKGNTPANDVRVLYSYGLSENPPYEVAEGEIVFDTNFTDYEKLGLIAPRGDHIIRTPKYRKITGPEFQKWKLSQLQFYCWGRIIYDDIFNQERRTEFAFFQGQGYPHGSPCEYGNKAI
jgi:hypothetical protein